VRAIRGAGAWLALVPLPTLIAMSLDTVAWRRILLVLGCRVSWRRLLELRLSVESVVLAVPGGSVAGEGMKLALLARRMAVPFGAGAASLALTKALLTAAAALYLTIGVVLLLMTGARGADPAATRVPAWLGLAGALFTAVLAVVSVIVLRGGAAFHVVSRWLAAFPVAAVRRWIDSRRVAFARVDAGARAFFAAPRSTQLACFLPFALEWLMEGVETFVILRCLHAAVGFGDALVLDGVGSLLRTIVFFVPAGLGFQDGAQVALLGMLGVGDAPATGAAFIFIKRTKELFWIVTGATFLAVRRDLWQRPRSPAKG
jgi:uncharacterized membrane protein YbhN (UPF0104 family)